MNAAASGDNSAPLKAHRSKLMSAIGAIALATMLVLCLGSIPYTFGKQPGGVARYAATDADAAMLPPFWAPHAEDEMQQVRTLDARPQPSPMRLLGTDRLGRSVLVRCLAGGAISLTIGIAAGAIAVIIGTLYGTIAGACGGRIDALMMRIVDVLFGLPYILLVVLLAVAVNGLTERAQAVEMNQSNWHFVDLLTWIDRDVLNLITLLVAIGGVSWLTMARVIRGQVLSLKQQAFMEACRAIGVPRRRQFFRHLLPNLLGPIIVYATLTVPTAILSESFLSFLGIGVQEPLPSWGNLVASGLSELNTVRARWWLLLWPCLFIAITLLSLNFIGEALRERFDPKRSR